MPKRLKTLKKELSNRVRRKTAGKFYPGDKTDPQIEALMEVVFFNFIQKEKLVDGVPISVYFKED